MASGRLKPRKSISGSGRSRRKGSTIRRVRAWARACAPLSSRTRAACSSVARASALGWRSSGRFESARRTARSRAATAGDPESTGGCSCSTAWVTSNSVRPSKALRPASISNSSAPAAKTSLRASRGSPRSCSGAMYCGVPTSAPAWVSSVAVAPPAAATGRARPKSSSVTPAGVRNTFEGLRSRCTSPRACRACSAASTPSIRGTASATGRAPRARRTESASPSSSSMASQASPPSSPTSKIWQTLGCVAAAAARASRQKRRRAESSSGWSRMTLSATWRPRRWSSAA